MTIRIGDRQIGTGYRCFIVAEAGSNHNRSLTQAAALIDIAAAAGADAVKFQLFRADRLYPKSAGTTDYLQLPKPIHDLIAEMELPEDWVPQLARRCRERGVFFLASPFDEGAVDWLDPYVEAFKIASYEITHLPLIACVARKGKPVILSTGAANLDEVAEAVTTIRQTGNHQLILMQCTAAYPAPLESLNIRVISTLRSTFGVPVGLSDHSRDPLVGPLVAVAAGADALEKHFTFSNALPGPDHRFALEPDELHLMIQKVREAERALGSGGKVVHPVEAELRAFARRSIFAVRDIALGEVFTRDNIAVLRCGKLSPGLEPRRFPELLGRRARRTIPAEHALGPDDME